MHILQFRNSLQGGQRETYARIQGDVCNVISYIILNIKNSLPGVDQLEVYSYNKVNCPCDANVNQPDQHILAGKYIIFVWLKLYNLDIMKMIESTQDKMVRRKMAWG